MLWCRELCRWQRSEQMWRALGLAVSDEGFLAQLGGVLSEVISPLSNHLDWWLSRKFPWALCRMLSQPWSSSWLGTLLPTHRTHRRRRRVCQGSQCSKYRILARVLWKTSNRDFLSQQASPWYFCKLSWLVSQGSIRECRYMQRSTIRSLSQCQGSSRLRSTSRAHRTRLFWPHHLGDVSSSRVARPRLWSFRGKHSLSLSRGRLPWIAQVCNLWSLVRTEYLCELSTSVLQGFQHHQQRWSWRMGRRGGYHHPGWSWTGLRGSQHFLCWCRTILRGLRASCG